MKHYIGSGTHALHFLPSLGIYKQSLTVSAGFEPTTIALYVGTLATLLYTYTLKFLSLKSLQKRQLYFSSDHEMFAYVLMSGAQTLPQSKKKEVDAVQKQKIGLVVESIYRGVSVVFGFSLLPYAHFARLHLGHLHIYPYFYLKMAF